MENLLWVAIFASGAAFWNTIQISKQLTKTNQFLMEKLGTPQHPEDYK